MILNTTTNGNFTNGGFLTIHELTIESTYAKVHGSVSVDVVQRKEIEESACGKVHDPVLKITEIYFQEKLLCYFLVKNGNY